jgi:signal transduction histidine kinase
LVEQQGDAVALQAAVELMFFRVAQEAVTNALRHGNAKMIHVLLSYQADKVILAVRDNGCGFLPNSASATLGIGLLGMRERVAALAGCVEIESAPGKGCCITVTMPLLKEPP